MKNTDLKTFDIASYDMEIEFNKKLAPVKKKIDTLNRNHEKKSLENHKDFLSKEKKHKKKLKELTEKALLREQRIEKATQNKLKKFVNSDAKLKAQYEEFKMAQEEANKILLDEIDELIAEMKVAEEKDIKAIQMKYDENVKSYNEKLAKYNENYINNVDRHTKHLEKYQKLVDSKIKEINEFKTNSEKILDQELEKFIQINESRPEEVKLEEKEKQKDLTKNITAVKRTANLKIKEIKTYIEDVKHQISEKYDSFISSLTEHVTELTMEFESRKELINKDTNINLAKLKEALENADEDVSAKQKKAIELKIAVFEQRATTTISFEEAMLKEQLKLLNKEISELETTKNNELLNYDKLEVFLLSDQQELKESGDYFKEINFQLLQDLNNSEFAHNDYLAKHEKLKNEYFKNFNDIFNTFKLALLEANQSTIVRLGEINQEIDEINKYLDTAEPLKEIEVNNIRVDIEKSEIVERYKIKYAKQEHERKQLMCNLEQELMIEEQDIRAEMLENNKEITDIKNKEKFDKDLETVKLKYNKAEENTRLKHNQTRLERSLLKSNYETEIAIHDHKKDIKEIEIQRENALHINELKSKIATYEVEANYKIEVINQGLIEENLKLDDEINNLMVLEQANSARIDKEIAEEQRSFDKQEKDIEKQFSQKEKLIDKALERELSEPVKSLQKSNQVISDRLRGFTQNEEIYHEFIQTMLHNVSDETINDEQRKTVLENDSMFLDKTRTFLTNMYDALEDAVRFIYQLEVKTVESKLASTSEESKKKKWNKEIQKIHSEHDKQLQKLSLSRKENVKAITDSIYQGKTAISQDKQPENGILHQIEQLLNNIESSLLKLQNGVIEEVKKLYQVLTINDEKQIQHAEENAVKAKAILAQEKSNTLQPYIQSLQNFIDAKESERNDFKVSNDAKIDDIKSQIRSIKEHALAQVKIIEEEKVELAKPYLEQLEEITSTESERIQRAMEQIESQKNDIELAYQKNMNVLSLKDSEAEKLLEYEKRIYNLAVETCEARLNDSNMKTEKAYMDQMANVDKKKAEIKEKHDKRMVEINRELVELTKQFENNIFTVRPRLEESIGDAQKHIDMEMEKKRNRLEQLNEISEQVMTTTENTMLAKYHECYNRLLENLQFYFDKLKLIKDQHMQQQRDNNDTIEENSAIFSSALFELSKSKHQKTIKKLLAINEQMIGKED